MFHSDTSTAIFIMTHMVILSDGWWGLCTANVDLGTIDPFHPRLVARRNDEIRCTRPCCRYCTVVVVVVVVGIDIDVLRVGGWLFESSIDWIMTRYE